jgi:hypothetical protein
MAHAKTPSPAALEPPSSVKVGGEPISGARPKGVRRGDGGTIRPVYGERRPMTYHLFETEMKSISALNGEALRYFSVGSFMLAAFLNIIVASVFASPPLSDAGKLLMHYGLWVTGGLSMLCYGLGAWAIRIKVSIINQIKRETVAK